METEQLLKPREAGKILANKHPRDVIALAKSGRLRAKVEIVRGTGKRPRYLFLLSDLQRYMRELPDYCPSNLQESPARRRRRSKMPSDIIEFV